MAKLQREMEPSAFLTLQQMIVNAQETMARALKELTAPGDNIRDKHFYLLLGMTARARGFDAEGAKTIATLKAKAEAEAEKKKKSK